MTWKGVAIALMVLFALELVWVYAHWGLIQTAWSNRETLTDLGDVGSGVSGVLALAKKL